MYGHTCTYCRQYDSNLLYSQIVSLIPNTPCYKAPFPVDAMVYFCTMSNGTWNAKIQQMCSGYHIINHKIIVLKSTKRRFSKLDIMKIRESELKPIDRTVVKKYICI